MKNRLVDMIYQSLRLYQGDDKYAKATLKHIRIHDVSLGSDHKSSEVIITLDDGEQKKDFVISNNDIREIE